MEKKKTELSNKENMDMWTRKLFAEMFVIVGSILLAIGISYFIQDDDYWKRFMLPMGFILVLFGVLTRLPEIKNKLKIKRSED